ncbi:MAG: tRNA uridine-5-carboxymethylaminomethyl(34) synthesis GTPase MnmE, partial [Sphingomonas sp.]
MTTIFAVSSGTPPAAIAVMRISGPAACAAGRALCGALPPPRQASLRAVRHPVSGDLLDRAILLWFDGPATATGEDLVELHLHGGRAIVASVTGALGSMPGLRPAEPGEFTRRALAAGRIDLAEAEGLADLLVAETESQRRRALSAAEGEVSRAVGRWSDRVLLLSAQVEALLDFSDEDDVASEGATDEISEGIAALGVEIDEVLATPPVERLRDGLRVVLAGPPNAGKSTLLNTLAARDAAIVSPIAGTTRDRIEAPLVRDGIAYVLTDTAGLAAETADPIEALGIERTGQAIAQADILLWLGDTPPPAHPTMIWLYPRLDERPPCPVGRLGLSARTG